MRFLAVVIALFFLFAPTPGKEKPPKDSIEAPFWKGPTALDARADKPMWRHSRPVVFQHDWRGDPLVGNQTTVRALWTADELWLLFGCGYEALTISPQPQTSRETDRLWAISDVAEAFIAPNPGDILRYKEFQVSPAGEWVDLHIDRETKKHDVKWDSGFRTAARIDAGNQTWWGEMAIPLKAFAVQPPTPGTRWRLNFFRWEHGPPRRAIAWQPTHTPEPNFHLPQVFGWLEFKK